MFPALVAATFVLAVEVRAGEQPTLQELLLKYLSDLEAVAKGATDPAPASTAGATRAVGLQAASLGGAALQPAAGLHTTAVGLTPAEEWRRLFPRKER